MSRETIKKNLPFIQAFAEGRAVEYRFADRERFSDRWDSIVGEPHVFSDPDFEFRIKPEPREFWINVYSYEVCIYDSKEDADGCAGVNRLECIHVREVVDEG